jgi:hypothetical protein
MVLSLLNSTLPNQSGDYVTAIGYLKQVENLAGAKRAKSGLNALISRKKQAKATLSKELRRLNDEKLL